MQKPNTTIRSRNEGISKNDSIDNADQGLMKRLLQKYKLKSLCDTDGIKDRKDQKRFA
ncbi:hypothetical protein [Prochlorococcus marinus]|uniref:hypothetical protein n=1 Tax=Prochlorococcus marinus TaxID=1219 RepID=UPI0022B4FD24|nr:hypothetical protein [Prochlorococcus marinus]